MSDENEKPPYSLRRAEVVDPLVEKYLQNDKPEVPPVRKQKSFYLDEKIHAEAYAVVGSKLNGYVEDCLARLVKEARKRKKPMNKG